MRLCLNPNCQQQNISGTKFCILCGTNFLLRERYQVIEFIGEGAFGRTFKAVDQDKLNKTCVVKQFLPQQIGSGPLAKATELFQQEAERLDHLGSHPQIPDLLAFFEQDGRLYLIQQFIDGQDLFKELNQNGRFNEQQVRDLLNQLLPVLDFIHSHNVIHRDIKPDNIIRAASGRNLVLIDFGVSKLLSGSILTKMGTIAGTPGYAPHEQMRGMVYPASDLYSLGVTCVRLLTGCLPQSDGSDKIYDPMRMEWTWRRQVSVSDTLGLVLDKLLQDRVSDRYQSAGEVKVALTPTSPPPRASSTKSSNGSDSSTVAPKYAKLRDLLAAKQWGDADEETVRVMLKITGMEKQGWLNDDSIKNFPCSDLRTIDELWVKYSAGRFGFSVQNNILNDVNNDWNKWGEKVGWRERGKNEWRIYTHQYSNAFGGTLPKGFFPFDIWISGLGVWWNVSWLGSWRVRSLIHRFNMCN